jgi:hypothetical protein
MRRRIRGALFLLSTDSGKPTAENRPAATYRTRNLLQESGKTSESVFEQLTPCYERSSAGRQNTRHSNIQTGHESKCAGLEKAQPRRSRETIRRKSASKSTSAMLSRQHAPKLESVRGNRAPVKGAILERIGLAGSFQNHMNVESPKGLTAGLMNQRLADTRRAAFLESLGLRSLWSLMSQRLGSPGNNLGNRGRLGLDAWVDSGKGDCE